MYDGLFVAPDDNPTIGLILCAEKNETVARYSVLNDRKWIFASKYMLCLPTEERLRVEIEKERRMIERVGGCYKGGNRGVRGVGARDENEIG